MTTHEDADATRPDDPEDEFAGLYEVNGLTYDPSEAPDAEAWLALDEQERMMLIQAGHHRLGAELPTEKQRRLHAIAHTVAENQLAEDTPPEARQTMERLLQAGVKRHSAVHAIGNEIVAVMHQLLTQGEKLEPGTYEAALESIDPEEWIGDTAGLPDA